MCPGGCFAHSSAHASLADCQKHASPGKLAQVRLCCLLVACFAAVLRLVDPYVLPLSKLVPFWPQVKESKALNQMLKMMLAVGETRNDPTRRCYSVCTGRLIKYE